MAPKRVLQFGMTSNPGGIESFIMNYYRNMNHKKVQFDFVDMYGGIAYSDEIKRLGGRIYNIPYFKRFPLRNYFAIKKLITENQYNVVHVNMLSAAYILPLIAAKKSGVKCIIAHSHNSSSPPGLVRSLLDKLNKSKVKKNSTHLFACSEIAGRWMFGEDLDNNMIKVIKNAINISDFSFNEKTRRNIRKNFGLEDKFVIGHVGRFDYQKNHDFLIDIFNNILKRKPNAYLVLVGDGKLRDSIEKKIIELDITDSVLFLGVRPDINDLMQAMDLFILPSHFEGLGIVAIEAQTSGLNCLLSDQVSGEAKVTDHVKYLSLTKPPEYWAEKAISSINGNKREDSVEKIKKTGYDIITEAKSLESFYQCQSIN